ncbi:MAG: histidinol-phosphate transaminase [Treponemataceae bacterium]|nr:MAG: histidinol-phosphate transaminase [Treponemataceae bacterium]
MDYASRIAALKPYVPGEQPSDKKYIKLNANENPYPPPPCVAAAVSALVQTAAKKCALYPDPDSNALRQAIAAMLRRQNPDCNITPEMIFCGNGSDEVLSFVFFSFFDSSVPLVLPEFTYSFYPVYSHFYGIPLARIPLTQDFSINTDLLCEAARKTASPMILANPNAPTGRALTRTQIEKILQNAPQNKAVVIDEAYIDFADSGTTCLPLLSQYENLVIVRTFSKSFAFAGMRLGFAVAHPSLIAALTTAKNSFNHFPVDVLTQTAGVAACSPEAAAYYAQCTQKIIDERTDFSAFLDKHDFFVLPSQTNFVFARHQSANGKMLYTQLKEQGILVRRFDDAQIADFLRITIGTPAEMDSLKNGIAAFV